MVITELKDSAVSWAILEPFSTALIEFSIRAAVFLDASALLLAKFLTSSATTAKPFPAEPARAASTAAFNASMFVWNAMSSIVLIILPISVELFVISFIAPINSSILALLCSISSLISFTFWLT